MSAFQEQTNQYVQQIKAGANSILVTVRVRPLSQKQRKISTFQTVKVLQGKLLSLVQPQSWSPVDILRKNRSKQIQYAFDFVFDQQINTKTIYEQTVSILLEGLLQGYNASVLAYGATSCGKTYTMVGQNQNTPGLMAMTVLQLLNIASQAKKYQDIKLKASYIQIYNQNVKDLLISQDRNLDIREDPKEGVSIPGVTEVPVDNINQLKTVLKVGNRNRTMESTGCNQVSSRSHGIFQIRVQVRNKAQSTTDETILSKLFLIDLAGSQRASNTTNRGLRMVQGAKINQSLLVLGNCIQALSDASEKGLKNAFVPYRGSKLTRLLKDSLGGNCRTVMIAHIAPAANLFQQTYNTLVYAHRAKNIKNNPIRNTLVADTHLSNYVNVINNLKRQNQQLKNQIKLKQINQKQKQRNSPFKNSSSLPLLENSFYSQELAKYQSIILKQFSEQDNLSQKISDIEMKLQQIAFSIFEKQLFKNNQKQIKLKSVEASELSKQKIKLQKKLQQKVQSRNKIIRQIQRNQILGSIGQTTLKNNFKQKKIESALKVLKYKQNLIKQQKKQMDVIMKKIKSSLKNRENLIQKQKLLIKKNNIISRITYSQIDSHINDDSLSVKSQRKSTQKLKNQHAPISFKKLQISKSKPTQNVLDKDNSSLFLNEKRQKSSQKKQRISVHKKDKIDKNTHINQIKYANNNTIDRNERQSPQNSQRKKLRSLKKNNKNSKDLLKVQSQNKKQLKFDFIYLPH